ncbi:MAG: cob(I)alamin adenosyltransferase [Candidatus Tokpelaia sp. JSC189]|nr:MAG: cob(I)alamin adenosyltransferase [Candidatus Tokpelaia sp. JSC189]
MNAHIEPLKSFVLPGGTSVATCLHLARTVARRAERIMVDLYQREKVNPYGLILS